MTEVISRRRTRTIDTALRERARAVIPGGMYGHLGAGRLPAEYPQFYQRAEGAHVWDVDGNEYVDFMCSFGPNLLGHKHPKVEQAAAAQRALGDTMSGPGVPMAAAVATITAIREERAIPAMTRIGAMLREGLGRAAAEAEVEISQTGPVQLPNMSFPGDQNYARADTFCAAAAEHGVIFHPRHNWFISAAHTESDVERALAAARAGMRAVRGQFGRA